MLEANLQALFLNRLRKRNLAVQKGILKCIKQHKRCQKLLFLSSHCKDRQLQNLFIWHYILCLNLHFLSISHSLYLSTALSSFFNSFFTLPNFSSFTTTVIFFFLKASWGLKCFSTYLPLHKFLVSNFLHLEQNCREEFSVAIKMPLILL